MKKKSFKNKRKNIMMLLLHFHLVKGSDPATDQRFNEYRKESKSRSDQAAGKLQDF